MTEHFLHTSTGFWRNSNFLYPFSWSRMSGASRMQIDHFLYKNIYGLGVRFISFPSISFMRRCVKQRQIQRCEDVTGCKLLVGVSAGIIWRCRHSMWCRTYFFVTLCRFSLSPVWKHIIRYNIKFSWNHCQFELRDSQWVKFLWWNVEWSRVVWVRCSQFSRFKGDFQLVLYVYWPECLTRFSRSR